MLGIVIVLVNAFVDLCGRNANDRIGIGIVIRRAVKDLDAEDALLQISSVAFQRAPDYEPQELGIALAGNGSFFFAELNRFAAATIGATEGSIAVVVSFEKTRPLELR